MSQYAFGSGALYGVSSASGSTPVKFGAIHEVNVDFSFNVKELYGQFQFPLAIARGTGKITGKAKFGQIQSNIYNSLYFTDTQTTGSIIVANDEAGTIPASSTYTITVSHGSVFEADLGVRYADGSGALTLVTSLTAVGQYTVNTSTGLYTFYSGDASKKVLLSYSYTSTSTGNKTTLSNQLIGVAPTFQIVLSENFNGKNLTLRLKNCISSKLTMPFKQEDFMVSELDFMCSADASNNVLDLSMDE